MSSRGFLAGLNQISRSVEEQFRPISYVEAGFLLREQTREFIAGVRFLFQILEQYKIDGLKLREASSSIEDLNKDLLPTLRRLCELSREISFIAISDEHVDLRSDLERLFRLVTEPFFERDHLIVDDPKAKHYLENIRERRIQPIAVV